MTTTTKRRKAPAPKVSNATTSVTDAMEKAATAYGSAKRTSDKADATAATRLDACHAAGWTSAMLASGKEPWASSRGAVRETFVAAFVAGRFTAAERKTFESVKPTGSASKGDANKSRILHDIVQKAMGNTVAGLRAREVKVAQNQSNGAPKSKGKGKGKAGGKVASTGAGTDTASTIDRISSARNKLAKWVAAEKPTDTQAAGIANHGGREAVKNVIQKLDEALAFIPKS